MECSLKTPLLRFFFAVILSAAARAQGPVPAWTASVPETEATTQFPLTPGVPGALGKTFSIELSLHKGALQKPGPLLRIVGSNEQVAVKAEVATAAANGGALEFRVTTDFNPQPLLLATPLRLLNPTQPHVFLLRDLGFRLELFADGVLIDEEWPVGSVAAEGTRLAEATSAVADVRIWSQALPEEVIEARNGGRQAVMKRNEQMLGPAQTSLQYWRPRGFNTSAGDAMPFFRDGVFHVFYLIDRRHHHSKWGLGAHQWGHMSSTDLVHWKTYPTALAIDQESEGSICTGSVFFQNGKFYAFYATRMPDHSEHLNMAVSDDGVAFHKLSPSPFGEPALPYRRGPNRDPFVFSDGKKFHMMATASLATPLNAESAGALEHLTSPDLLTWKVEPTPFLVPGYAADPECSDLFLWRGWYYLLFSKGGQTHYRMSRNQLGPWTKPAFDVFDGVQARVMKTAAFPRDRRLGVAFIPDGNFGGHLVFRELVQSPDGTLGTKFPAEMIPHGTPFTHPGILPGAGAADQSRGTLVLHAGASPSSAEINVPKNFILTATLAPDGMVGNFGFRFGEETASNISTLAIKPASKTIAWTSSAPSSSGRAPSLDHLDGLSGPLRMQMVVTGTIVDTSINGLHTLAYRLPEKEGQRITVYAENGDLALKDLTIERIEDHP